MPPAHERRYDEYCRTLLGKRFIRAEEVLDLGHLAHPRPEVHRRRPLAVVQGHRFALKSLLKLLLTEAYASEHPRVLCVALRFHEQVFAGSSISTNWTPRPGLSPSRTLPVEQQAPERLELVRRCLYLEVGRKLGGRQRQAQKGWQHLSMERLVAEMAMEPRRLALLDSRSRKMRQVMEERRTVVNELTYSYRLLFPDRPPARR